jgi:ribosomal protein S18 acetylase RimI-like enzyme
MLMAQYSADILPINCLALVETERKSIYLETQKEANISLYEKYGFSVEKKVMLPDPLNLPMWLMILNST